MAEGGFAAHDSNAAQQPAAAPLALQAEVAAAMPAEVFARTVSCTLPLAAHGVEAAAPTELANMVCAPTQLADPDPLAAMAAIETAAAAVAAGDTVEAGTLADALVMTAWTQMEVATGAASSSFPATQQLLQDTAGDAAPQHAGNAAGATGAATVPGVTVPVDSAAADGTQSSAAAPAPPQGDPAAAGAGVPSQQTARQLPTEMTLVQPSQAPLALTAAAEQPGSPAAAPMPATEDADAAAATTTQPEAGEAPAQQPAADSAARQAAGTPEAAPPQQPVAAQGQYGGAEKYALEHPAAASQQPPAAAAAAERSASQPSGSPAQPPAPAPQPAPPLVPPAADAAQLAARQPAPQQPQMQAGAVSFEEHQHDSFDTLVMMQPSQAPMLLTSEGGSDAQPGEQPAQAPPASTQTASLPTAGDPGHPAAATKAQPASLEQQASVAATPADRNAASAAPDAATPAVESAAAPAPNTATPAAAGSAARPAQPLGGSAVPAGAPDTAGCPAGRMQTQWLASATQIARSLLLGSALPDSAAAVSAAAAALPQGASPGSQQTTPEDRRSAAFGALAMRALQGGSEAAGLNYSDCVTSGEVAAAACDADSQVRAQHWDNKYKHSQSVMQAQLNSTQSNCNACATIIQMETNSPCRHVPVFVVSACPLALAQLIWSALPLPSLMICHHGHRSTQSCGRRVSGATSMP